MAPRASPAPPVGPPPSARTRLRRATRCAHERVDALPRMRRLLAPDVSRKEYAGALHRLYRLHTTLCGRIPPRLGDLAHAVIGPRDLLAGLEQDVARLGVGTDRARVAAAPPSLDTPAQALGAWYVLEGAALGGAVIARHLRGHLGAGIPLAHFGRSARGRWPLFLAHLEAGLPGVRAQDEAVEGARRCYAYTEAVLGA